ncbi:hypothetical protein JZ751_008777 [Albula glossodonta]|uniref:Uncharacterized protein n=1 Tax=Albula glossodonta TaxID=121402 RepID=A0A8T2NX74_9TELE|nr:hypothetical protein JZ751_008777 [Albula glossodonta]
MWVRLEYSHADVRLIGAASFREHGSSSLAVFSTHGGVAELSETASSVLSSLLKGFGKIISNNSKLNEKYLPSPHTPFTVKGKDWVCRWTLLLTVRVCRCGCSANTEAVQVVPVTSDVLLWLEHDDVDLGSEHAPQNHEAAQADRYAHGCGLHLWRGDGVHGTQDDQHHIVGEGEEHAGVAHITLEDDRLPSLGKRETPRARHLQQEPDGHQHQLHRDQAQTDEDL